MRILAIALLVSLPALSAQPAKEISILDAAALGYAQAMREGPLTDVDHARFQYRMKIGLQVDRGQLDPGVARQLVAKSDLIHAQAKAQEKAHPPADAAPSADEVRRQQYLDNQRASERMQADSELIRRQQMMLMIQGMQRPAPINCTSTSLPGTGQINTNCR